VVLRDFLASPASLHALSGSKLSAFGFELLDMFAGCVAFVEIGIQ
jgi:hypothetical protein